MINWLRRKLGFPAIENTITAISIVLGRRHDQTQNQISALHDRLDITNAALGRLVAKVDPDYVRPEISKQRKAESDALGEQVINKIKAEHSAMQATSPRRI